MRLRLSALAIALLAAAALAATAVPAGKPPHEPARPSPVTHLGVVQARNGTLERKGRAYTLTLRNVDPTAVWFTDRPYRDAGTDTTKRVVSEFFKGSSPPNAAVQLQDGRKGGDTVILTLTHPRFAAGGRTLTFGATVIKSVPTRFFAYKHRIAHVLPKTFGRSTILLDGAWQLCTVNVYSPGNVHGWVDYTKGDEGIDDSATHGGAVVLPHPFFNGRGGDLVVYQQGGIFDGCGGGVWFDVTVFGANGSTDLGDVYVTWLNPESGTNSASCSFPAGSAMQCSVEGDDSGLFATFNFVITGPGLGDPGYP